MYCLKRDSERLPDAPESPALDVVEAQDDVLSGGDHTVKLLSAGLPLYENSWQMVLESERAEHLSPGATVSGVDEQQGPPADAESLRLATLDVAVHSESRPSQRSSRYSKSLSAPWFT